MMSATRATHLLFPRLRRGTRPDGARSRRAFLRDLARLGGSLAGLGLLGACTPTPPPGQAPTRVYRVGLLGPAASTEASFPQDLSAEFWSRLAALGYVEGQNLTREERLGRAVSVDGSAPYDVLAAELAGLPVDVIVATGSQSVGAAAATTATVPIVIMGMDTVGPDPVQRGWVESLARPGKNVTGVMGPPPEVNEKRLQLLTEAVPGVAKVAVLGNIPQLPSWRSAAESLGVEVIPLPDPRDGYEAAFEYAVAQGAEALLSRGGLGTGGNAQLIGSLAERYRLPGISISRDFVTGGGLMAYEARQSEIQRRAAEYVDRILRGAHPGDLPVEQPSRYDLVVSLRAARALGLTLPPTFLNRVDEMIA